MVVNSFTKAWSGAFPWLSLEVTNSIKEKSKALSNDPYQQSLIQEDLYEKILKEKSHSDFINERTNWRMGLDKKSLEAKTEPERKTSNLQSRTWVLADMLRQYGFSLWKNRDSIPDQELIERFTAKNPWQKSDFDEFINWDENKYSFAQRMGFWIKEPTETLWQKYMDFEVGLSQSPWKWGYNIIWQWMDRLWKRWAEQLEWSALEKWVQDKAIEMFGEDEVKKYQQQTKKDIEEWTIFNGRSQTDIVTPLLWEERANSKATKIWETVWDIASWIALTAPIWAAVAPAIAWSSALWAAWIGAVEWGIDTLLTQYGSQWNLDVTPAQVALWVWLGAVGWMITNKLSNLPPKTAEDLTKKAQNQLRNDAKPYIEKSIKPTVKWKVNQADYDKFIDDTIDSVSDMVNHKELLQYTDDAWNIVKWELPTNMRETAEAISNYKKVIYDQYNAIAKQAGDAWARVNLNKVYQQLDDLSDDIAQNMANPWTKRVVDEFKKALLDYTDDAWTIAIEDAQKLTQAYNKQLTAFFKNPNMNDVSKNAIIANMNRGVKDAINDSIDDVLDTAINNGSTASQEYQSLKRLYWSLTNIEDEVSKRALVEARKNIKWLSDTLLDSFAGGEITDAVLTLNPVKAAKAWVISGLWRYFKYLNSPNTNIRKLFELVSNWSNPSLWGNIWTAARNNLDSVAKWLIPTTEVVANVAANENKKNKRVD